MEEKMTKEREQLTSTETKIYKFLLEKKEQHLAFPTQEELPSKLYGDKVSQDESEIVSTAFNNLVKNKLISFSKRSAKKRSVYTIYKPDQKILETPFLKNFLSDAKNKKLFNKVFNVEEKKSDETVVETSVRKNDIILDNVGDFSIQESPSQSALHKRRRNTSDPKEDLSKKTEETQKLSTANEDLEDIDEWVIKAAELPYTESRSTSTLPEQQDIVVSKELETILIQEKQKVDKMSKYLKLHKLAYQTQEALFHYQQKPVGAKPVYKEIEISDSEQDSEEVKKIKASLKIKNAENKLLMLEIDKCEDLVTQISQEKNNQKNLMNDFQEHDEEVKTLLKKQKTFMEEKGDVYTRLKKQTEKMQTYKDFFLNARSKETELRDFLNKPVVSRPIWIAEKISDDEADLDETKDIKSALKRQNEINAELMGEIEKSQSISDQISKQKKEQEQVMETFNSLKEEKKVMLSRSALTAWLQKGETSKDKMSAADADVMLIDTQNK